MATGTLGTQAKDYPAREQKISVNLTTANIALLAAGSSFKAGTLPAGSGILRGYLVNSATAFNAGTTNSISIGTASGGAQVVASTAMGAASATTVLTIVAGLGQLAADTPIWVNGIFTGAAPTAGQSLLVLEYSVPGST